MCFDLRNSRFSSVAWISTWILSTFQSQFNTFNHIDAVLHTVVKSIKHMTLLPYNIIASTQPYWAYEILNFIISKEHSTYTKTTESKTLPYTKK